MSRWSCALWGGLIALAVCGHVGSAAAEEPMVLLIDDPVLVPAEWQGMPQSEGFTKLLDEQLTDPFHGHDKLADPWPSAVSAKSLVREAAQCECRCADVLVPADWR